jgi:EmrB/QacA subfamily drug resistance transporter
VSTESPAARRPVSRGEFLRLFTAVMLPMFLGAVDQTLLAPATPTIAGDLGGLRDSFWIMTGYLITAAVIGPLYGRLGDRYGQREMLRYALVIFMLGATIAGFATSMEMLVGARVLQALGGGGLMVMAQALIGELVAPRERVRYQAYFSSIFTVSSVSGPVLGGLIVSSAGWRWLFWSVLPLAAIALWRVSLLPKREPRHSAAFADFGGLVLFALAGALSLLWLSLAGHRFAWASAPSVAALAGSIILWLWLLQRERRHASPFLPMELLRIRGVPSNTLTAMLSAATLFSMSFFIPIYLQLGLGVGAARAGVALVPIMLGLPIGGIIAGRVIAYTGEAKRLPALGLSIATLGLVALGSAPPSYEVGLVLGLLCGIGIGTVMPTTQLTMQALAGRERLGVAAALVQLARTFGGAVGTAATGALLFALMHGVDLRSVGSIAEQDRAAIVAAFRHAFIAVALYAACGAWVASRVPRVRF